MADRLNVHGKQTVARLQMSFAESDGRPRSEAAGDGGDGDGVRLDVDFRPADDMGDGARVQNGSGGGGGSKIFGQVLATRGEQARDEDEEHGGERDDRARRRGARETVGRRYRSALSYPLLDSFPEIFRDGKGHALREKMAVTTSLSTDAELSGKLKSLRSTVTRLIGLEDRENLSNELAEMADEYHEGWSSGSDLGDDD